LEQQALRQQEQQLAEQQRLNRIRQEQLRQVQANVPSTSSASGDDNKPQDGDYEVVKNGFRYTVRRRTADRPQLSGGFQIDIDEDGNHWQPGGIWVGEQEVSEDAPLLPVDEHAEAELVFGDYMQACC